jgi:glycosyltransferase involved in cell wall biosynthesis
MDVISSNNRIFSWLKDGAKTSKIVQLSNLVFAGNQYLAEYAKNFNKNVVIIPTTIDTDLYHPKYNAIKKDKVVIGWSGSISTIEHFQFAIPALESIKKTFGNRVEVKVIGDGSYRNDTLGIIGLPWRMDTELQELQSFDIGIMPLPKDEWTKGKCGLKGLQYMALEIPTIMSPVGVNTTIIEDGMNGYLAESKEDWIEKLTRLIESPDLRSELGKRGRKTVVDCYSVESQKNRYLQYFLSLTKQE